MLHNWSKGCCKCPHPTEPPTSYQLSADNLNAGTQQSVFLWGITCSLTADQSQKPTSDSTFSENSPWLQTSTFDVFHASPTTIFILGREN